VLHELHAFFRLRPAQHFPQGSKDDALHSGGVDFQHSRVHSLRQLLQGDTAVVFRQFILESGIGDGLVYNLTTRNTGVIGSDAAVYPFGQDSVQLSDNACGSLYNIGYGMAAIMQVHGEDHAFRQFRPFQLSE
jgi:hypothetical protein